MCEDGVGCDTCVDVQFFEMQRHDAIKALEIYKRAGQQVSWIRLISGLVSELVYGTGRIC